MEKSRDYKNIKRIADQAHISGVFVGGGMGLIGMGILVLYLFYSLRELYWAVSYTHLTLPTN